MRHLHTCCLLFAVLLGLTQAVVAGGNAGIEIETAEMSLVNDVYVLNADVSYRLSEQVRQALDNSVPLTVSLEVEVREPGGYLWDTQVARVRRDYRLEHLPLTERYVIDDLITGLRQSFYTLDDCLESLGHFVQVAVAESRRLQPKRRYRALMRTGLEIEALPAPLRLRAYLSSSWHLSSGWHKWNFDS